MKAHKADNNDDDDGDMEQQRRVSCGKCLGNGVMTVVLNGSEELNIP
jgi:hypothetical protein